MYGDLILYIYHPAISNEDTDIKLRTIPFELNENDEKFLQHANEIMGLKTSDLDKCYNRVMIIM